MIEVQMVRNGELISEHVDPSQEEVLAGTLAQSILTVFNQGSPLTEAGGSSDEDTSYALEATTLLGKRVEIPASTRVRLSDYLAFRVTPRTSGGRHG